MPPAMIVICTKSSIATEHAAECRVCEHDQHAQHHAGGLAHRAACHHVEYQSQRLDLRRDPKIRATMHKVHSTSTARLYRNR